MRTNCIFTYALVGAAALFLAGHPVAACEIWDWHPWISPPTITEPTPSNNCAGINGEVTFSCSLCTDWDTKTVDGTVFDVEDTVNSYTWSADGGSFLNGNNTGRHVHWTAPSTPGTYTVTVTVDDVDHRAPLGGGSDDDPARTASLIMHVEGFAIVRSTCTRSSPDETRYSGTGCTIQGWWAAGEGRHLTKVELWVNNTCRYRQEWSGSARPETFSVIAPFSSTQFPHLSEMTLKARCWDDHCATPGTDYEYKIAWNRGYVLYSPHMAGGVGNDAATWTNYRLTTMNHGTSGVIGTHTAQNICSNIPNYGVFYMYGHSVGDNGQGFWDCIYDPDLPGDPDPANAVLTATVAWAVAQKGPGQCPYVFVFLDSCYNGKTGAWLTAFGASAMLGWSGVIGDRQHYVDWTKCFWEKIAVSGETIASAREYAHQQVHDVTGDVCRGNNDLCLHQTYPLQCPQP